MALIWVTCSTIIRADATCMVSRREADVGMHSAHVAGGGVRFCALYDDQGMQVRLLFLSTHTFERLQSDKQYIIGAAAIPAGQRQAL